MVKSLVNIFLGVVCLATVLPGRAPYEQISKLENPITVEYLKKHLSKQSPKLILTEAIEKDIQRKLKTDPLFQSYYNYLKAEADTILTKPLLKRELEGFRLLFVSREMLQRMTILCMVYRIEKNQFILNRIDAELNAVCNFEDWNPQHFLDIAEMSLAVAIAVDWVGKWLPKETLQLAKTSLIENGIIPSYHERGERMGWINGTNNWNTVCHGGMVAASLAVADENPELAAKTIARALDKLPNSLAEYAPDGIYPEGPTYWSYGTGYAVVASNVLTTALGTDFGISQSTGFMESVNFLLHATAPSGDFFNFADSGDRKSGTLSVLKSWFAAKTGDGLYFDKSFFENIENAGRFAGFGLVWLSQFNQQKLSDLPVNWHGNGKNPVAVFRGENNNPEQFYLAAKGGKAQLSHGNMDAGTFVLDLNGVRWVVDPGNQNYYLLNKIGFNLAGHCQECPRWTLLTKSNFGHSTISVNDAPFDVVGQANIIDFKDGDQPEVTIDLTDLYFENLNSLQRCFKKESNYAILIEDNFVINSSTKNINWGIMTQAEVQATKNGAIFRQDGKELKLSILEPEGFAVSVVSLDPPPMEIDKTMENLKRIEIRIPAWTVKEHRGRIKVRLSVE
jgi:hypothetical protein